MKPDKQSIESIRSVLSKGQKHALLTAQLSKKAMITSIFVDMVDSTRLKTEKSQIEWLQVVADFLRRVTDSVIKHGGQVVKYIGDEVFAVFDEVDAESAIERIELFVRDCESILKKSEWEITAKYCADRGEAAVIDVANETKSDSRKKVVDYLGECVDRNARISKLTKPHCLIVGPGLIKSQNDAWRLIGVFRFKGIREIVPAYQFTRIGSPIIVDHPDLIVLSNDALIERIADERHAHVLVVEDLKMQLKTLRHKYDAARRRISRMQLP